ncbi:MAG TPA: hypothetical protein VI172_10905, partial [Candidatus Dormibacteraeota bacterium]
GEVVHSEEKDQTSGPPGVDESGLSCVCGDPVEWMAHATGPGWVHSPGADTTCVIARVRCPECQMPHRLVPGQPPMCRSIRARLADADRVAAAECSAQNTRFTDAVRQCIRAAQHRGDHIDEHGFHWSDTVAVYSVVACDHRCACGHAKIGHSLLTGYCYSCLRACPHNDGHNPEGCPNRVGPQPAPVEQERLADDLEREQRASAGLAEQIKKQRGALDQVGKQRNELAQALREVLAVFHEVKDTLTGQVIVHEASNGIHPSDFNNWRATLEGLPVNCRKPGGCADCPHETEG